MRGLLLIVVIALALPGRLLAQDHYDPARALSSEDLFLKQNPSNRAFTKPGERYLSLDTSPILGGFRRYRYFAGDQMQFWIKGRAARLDEEVYTVSDSSFSFAFVDEAAQRMGTKEVLLLDIKKIKTYRRIPWVTQGAFLLPLAGLVFIGADFFNKGIDDQYFTTDAQSLAVGGALATTGLVCYKLSFSTHRLNRRNRIKVLKTY